jgi:hypothetical protein
MHPETEIAADFWSYVNKRARGDQGEGEYFPSPPALMAELERQYWIIRELRGAGAEELKAYLVPSLDHSKYGESPVPWFSYGTGDDGYHLPPTGFPTLQAALYDYLLAVAGDVLVGNSYEVWLRSVTHILSDAVRDPGRLVIPVLKRTYDNEVYDVRETELCTMVISDDWGVLRCETFDFACRNYERHG